MSVGPAWPLPLAQEPQPRASPPLTEKSFWVPILLIFFFYSQDSRKRCFLCIEAILWDKFKPQSKTFHKLAKDKKKRTDKYPPDKMTPSSVCPWSSYSSSISLEFLSGSGRGVLAIAV